MNNNLIYYFLGSNIIRKYRTIMDNNNLIYYFLGNNIIRKYRIIMDNNNLIYYFLGSNIIRKYRMLKAIIYNSNKSAHQFPNSIMKSK
jgi:glucan-binding YG repeat protein